MPLIKPFRGIQINKTHILTRGLISCWLMNEGSGSFIKDMSGNSFNGTFYGNTSWTKGKFGHALAFDGSGDYVQISASIPTVNIFSISFWARSNVKPNGYRIFDKKSTWNAATGFTIHVEGSDDDLLAFIGANNTIGVLQNVVTSWSSGTWYHIVAIFNGTSVFVYRDGVYKGVVTIQAVVASIQNLFIGKYQAAISDWNGSIDNIQIWSRVLSNREIIQLYREPFAMFDRKKFFGLVA